MRIGSCYTERKIVFSYQQALYCSDKGRKIETECSGIQQRAVERNMPCPLSAGNGKEKLQAATKTVIQERMVKEIF